MVVCNDEWVDRGDEDRRGWSGYVPLADISRKSPEDYQALVEIIRSAGETGEKDEERQNFVDLLATTDEDAWTSSGTYIQSIIAVSNPEQRAVLFDYLQREGELFPRRYFAYSADDTHIHVLHSCAFASRMCTCHWRNNLPFRTKLKRGYFGRKPMGEFRRIDWLYHILYFLLQKWGNKEVWIDGKAYGLKDNLNSVRLEQLWKRLRPILERNIPEVGHAVLERSRHLEDVSIDRSSEETSSSGVGGKRRKTFIGGAKKGIWQVVQEKVQQLISTTAITPLSAIRFTKPFLSDFILTNPKNQCYVNAAIDLIALKYNNLSLRQFEELYNSKDCPTTLTFGVSMKYFPNHDDSFNIIMDLLKYQFDDDDEKITYFLQKLVDVIDKQPTRPSGREVQLKNNVIAVVSPHSSGKTFFFDMVFDLLVSKGKLTTLNRNCRFGFEDAYSKRIIEWNEPNYSTDKTEYIKEFFEGKDTLVERKGIPAVYVLRTPIIVTCNPPGPPFLFDENFINRYVKFEWKPAPFLKELQYKPYPLTFFKILKHFNIEY